MNLWLSEHRALLEDFTPWHVEATEEAMADAAVSIPAEGGNGGPPEHWLAMSTVHQHLKLLQVEASTRGEARPLHHALTQLSILLRRSDNYLARAASRGMPTPSRARLRSAAGKSTYARPQDAVAALADLQSAWQTWAQEIGPIEALPAAERHAVITLSALLDQPRPGATPQGWDALLSQVLDITRLRAGEVSDRMLGWQALGDVAEGMRQRWAATMLTEPGLAAAAARQTGVLHLTRPELDAVNPPTSHDDFASRHTYVIRLAQRVLDAGALRADERHSERVLRRLLETLIDGHEDLSQGVSPVLPALCHQIAGRAQQVWHEQADERELGHGDLLTTLNSTAARHAAFTLSLVDEADPQLQHEVAALTEQARADEQLLSTIRYSASSSATVPQAPALWAWLEQHKQDMSPRLRRALRSDIGPMGDLVGLFGTMWRALLDAAPAAAAPQLIPLPAAGTELPGVWQPWAEQVAAIADAVSSDIDLHLRLTGNLGDDANDLVSSFTEGHLAAAQDVLPAGLLELYFAEDNATTTAADTLHTFLLQEATARLNTATTRNDAPAPGAPVPAAALAAWHLQDPQGMGETEDPYPDQAAARAGTLQLLAALGEFTRTWSGAQYASEKALKTIADETAAALWQDATAEQIGTRPDAAQGCHTLVELAHAFQLRLEDDDINEPSISTLASAAYEHAARMHATTETLATSPQEPWPAGAEDGEQQRARTLAQTIDAHLPASQLMRAAGSETWDHAVTYTAPELYALALRTGADTPAWDNGVLTVTAGGENGERRVFTPVGETAGDTMCMRLRRPIGVTLEERAQAFETTVTEPVTTEAELGVAGAALNALHKDAVRHLRTVLTDNEQITALEAALPFIGGASSWQRQAGEARELAKAAAQAMHAVTEVIGRHSRHHTAQPAHHALVLLQRAADRLGDHLVPQHLSASGETYPAADMQQDHDGITALAYLLDHLPFSDPLPAEAGRELEEALRLRDGHREVGGLAGEMHRHQRVADAAKTVLNHSGADRAFFALALHNLASHHVDRLTRQLILPPDDAQRAPVTDAQAEVAPVPPGAQPYADAAAGRAAQEDLLELVRAAVLDGRRPLTAGHAPIVLAALMQARDHGTVYSDHGALSAFAEQARAQVHLHRLDKADGADALAAAARAAAAHAGNLGASARDADPRLHLALLELRGRAEKAAALAAPAEPGAEPQAAQRVVAEWLYGNEWQEGLPAEQITLLTGVITRSGADVLSGGPLTAWWEAFKATRPAAVATALDSEFPGGTVRGSITAFRNRRVPLLDQIERVLALDAVRERLASPHTDDLGVAALRRPARILARDEKLDSRADAYRATLDVARAARYMAERAAFMQLPAADQAVIAALANTARDQAADWIASADEHRIFPDGAQAPLCPPSPATAPMGSVTASERLIAQVLDDSGLVPAAWGGGGYTLRPNVDGSVAITMTMLPFEAPNRRDERIGSLRRLGFRPVTVAEDNPRSAHRGEARHVTVTLPRGLDAERHQLASEVRAVLDAHRSRTETFQVHLATERDFPGAATTTAVVARGSFTLDSTLRRAGYTTERLADQTVAVRWPQGAVPIGPNTPAHVTRPAAVRLAAVIAALRPVHTELITLLSAIQDSHPGLVNLDELDGMGVELAVLDEDFSLASNPPGVLDVSPRRDALGRTSVYGLLDLLKRDGARRNEALDQALVEVHGQGADRFVHGLAGTLQRLLHEYASGRDNLTQTRLAAPYGTWEEERSRLAAQSTQPPAPAPALAPGPESSPTTQAPAAAVPAPSGNAARTERDAAPGPADDQQNSVPPAAGGGAGRDNPPPPAPGGNDQPDQPDERAALRPVPNSGGSAPAFTRLREIHAPRTALSRAAWTLATTDHFAQRAAQDGPETALRNALTTFTQGSLNDPTDFHAAVEGIDAAVTSVQQAWADTAVPDDAARALAALQQNTQTFTNSWRATATSTAWETLFLGEPRPALSQTQPAPPPDTANPHQPAAQNDPQFTGAAMPSVTLAEQHEAIRVMINDFGTLNPAPNPAGAGLAAFVRRMQDPAQMDAWRQELVAAGTGIWINARHRKLHGISRLDPAPEGILISTRGSAERPVTSVVMRWEELPAWLNLGLTEQMRAALLEAEEALAAAPSDGPARARLGDIQLTIWDALQAAGAPAGEALAASWNRYSPAGAEPDSLFDVDTTTVDTPYTRLQDFTRATADLITDSWALIAHPDWPAAEPRARQLHEASAAVRAATSTTPTEAVRAVLLLARALQDTDLLQVPVPLDVKYLFESFAARARQHADRSAATAWGTQWRQVFPTAAEPWTEDPFLLPRLGYPDPRPTGPQTQEPLHAYEAGSNQAYEQITHPGHPDRRAYAVAGVEGFTVLAAPDIFHGPAYTLRAPDDTVVATLVKEGESWHTVLGDQLPHPGNPAITVLPPQPPQPHGQDSFHHAVLNALRVWAEDQAIALPGHPSYRDAIRLSWAFAELEPFTDALLTAALRTWPLTHTQQPALDGVLHALHAVQAETRAELDDAQIRAKADAIEQLAPATQALRVQLENEQLHGSDLYGLIRVLSGRALEMPGRLRAFADERTIPAPVAVPRPRTAAPAPEDATISTPAPDDGPPITEGGEWDPQYPVPETIGQLWRSAQAQGWTMTRSTDSGFASQRLNVELEAHTVVGLHRFSLQWHPRKGRFAADEQRSFALWPDGRNGPRGGTTHPKIEDALLAMRRYAAIPAPVQGETEAPAVDVVAAEPAATPAVATTLPMLVEEPGSAPAADESTAMPFDALEIAGMPGYWWRLEPPREGARDDIEHITVGHGTEQIGHGHGPNGQDGAVKWRMSVGTEYMPGERTPSASAKKIAEHHLALQEAASLTGPRAAEAVWVYHERDHGDETRTYVYGVAETDKDAQAALKAEDFLRAPSHDAHVQRAGTRPDTRAYKTGQFVRRMLKHGRSIAVHYTRDGAPADTNLPELSIDQRRQLDALTPVEQRDWSPIEFQIGDQILLHGSHTWWHTVTAVHPEQLAVELETVYYGKVLARRRGQNLLTAADAVGELTTARPGSIALRNAPPEALEAEQARLELPLADPQHSSFVEARRAEIATERERVSGKLARLEKQRSQLQAFITNHKELKAHSGKQLFNEAGELLGAVINRDKMANPPGTRTKSSKWIVADLDGHAVSMDRKGAADEYAITLEDRRHQAAPGGWRRGFWSQISPGATIRMPAPQDNRLTPETWTPALTVTGVHRAADGSMTIDGTREGEAVTYRLSPALAKAGPLREAVGELALLPETIVARAARPALLAALLHPTNGVACDPMDRELDRSMQAVTAAAEAIKSRPTPVAKLQQQITTARDALAHLAAVARSNGVEDMPERALASVEVMEHWSAQLQNIEAAAAELTAQATVAVQSPGEVPANEPTPTNGETPADAVGLEIQTGLPRTQTSREDSQGAPSLEAAQSTGLPEGQMQIAAEPQDQPLLSDYDALRLGGRALAAELASRATLADVVTYDDLRAVLLDGVAIGHLRPDGEGWRPHGVDAEDRGEIFESQTGAIAWAVAAFDRRQPEPPSPDADVAPEQIAPQEDGQDTTPPLSSATSGENARTTVGIDLASTPWSSYDTYRFDGEEIAQALVARATVGDLQADGHLMRAPVLMGGQTIGSIVTGPAGGYAATTIDNWTTKDPFRNPAGAVAAVVRAYDIWEDTREEREALHREFDLIQEPAAPAGELPYDATPVPDHPEFHQAMEHPGIVVYGPDRNKIGSVETRTYAQGKHKTLYGDSPLKGKDTIWRSVRHLVDAHIFLHDTPNQQLWTDVWIEHNREHTYVWGAARQYRELGFALELAGGPQGFNRRDVDGPHQQHGTDWHALPTNYSYKKRGKKLDTLRRIMARRGRDIPVFENLEAKQAAFTGDPTPVYPQDMRFAAIPDLEPGPVFNATAEVRKTLQDIKTLHTTGLRYNTAWYRITKTLGTEGRHDARRLNAAIDAVRGEELFTVPQPLALARLVELARAARTVADRLRDENTPALHRRIEELADLAEPLAARALTTAERPMTWQAVFKTPVADDSAMGSYQRAYAQAWAQWWTVVSSGYDLTGTAGSALQTVMLGDQLPAKAASVQDAVRALTALHTAASDLQRVLLDNPDLSHPQIQSAVAAIATIAHSNLPHKPGADDTSQAAPALGKLSQTATATGEHTLPPAVEQTAASEAEAKTPVEPKTAILLAESGPVPVADPQAAAAWEESNPRPAQRLGVFRERTNVIVTGTEKGEGDAELREWLKDKHFSYIQEAGRWESNHGGWRKNPKTNIFAARLEKDTQARINALDVQWQQTRDRLGQALTPEMRAEYEQKALAAEKNTLTAQQRAIVTAAQNGLNVAVQALAGTGKTSTMVALARRMLNRRITYLAFNSANALDARQKFAGLRHVSVSTAHSLAARGLMSSDLAQKVQEGKADGGTGPNGNADWAEFLGVRSHPASDGGDDLAPEDIVVLIKETIKNFRNSDADAPDLTHVPDADHPLLDIAARRSRLRRDVLEYARDAWADKTDPDSREVNFHHDDYLKIWALSRPKIHADTIIFDEAQDINPVLRKVVYDNM
ncbi:hypothetical protein ACVWYT_003125, partial [Streptomyces sp. TE4109]